MKLSDFKGLMRWSLASMLSLSLLAGCTKDDIDQPEGSDNPTNPDTPEQVDPVPVEEIEAAFLQLQKTMYSPQGEYFDNYLFDNGEPYMNQVYGEVLSQDYFSYLWANSTGPNYMWENNTNPEAWIITLPWVYYYNLINQANSIIRDTENPVGDANYAKYLKAQALTIRAHSYTRLLQLYAPRYEDSNNGDAYCVVKRLEPNLESAPLIKMNEVYNDIIVADLENAISLFNECESQFNNHLNTNSSVAKGLYARAAMLMHKWDVAQAMAHDARQNYPIMEADYYLSGFRMPDQEWMWYILPQDGGYTTFGCMYACNGAYPGVWNMGAGAINYELYRKIEDEDIRKKLFLAPDKIQNTLIKSGQFWSENYVNPDNMSLTEKNQLMTNLVVAYNMQYTPTGGLSQGTNQAYYNFQAQSPVGVMVPLGAQYKFWGEGEYNFGFYALMRGAEMLLAEAEAAYHNGQPSVAVANLLELNAKRNPNYTCNLSGDALYEEIKLQRRLELWGEGHNFFDLKRWNMPMVRNPWIAGDSKSNNIPAAYQINIPASDSRWVLAVPKTEETNNPGFNRSLLN